MQINWSEIFQQVILAGGGAAVIAFGLFRWFGQKWIEGKFNQQLEQQRHANATALAEAKVKWDADLQGRLKYQEREFTSVGEAWRKLQEAHNLLIWVTSPGRSFANVGIMSENQLDEFLAQSELLETQKTELRRLPNLVRQNRYEFLIMFHRLAKTESSVKNLAIFVNENFPFIPDELFTNFGKLVEDMYSALSHTQVGHEDNVREMLKEAQEIAAKKVKPQFETIKTEVRTYMVQVRKDISIPR